jgi:hypothetical protein
MANNKTRFYIHLFISKKHASLCHHIGIITNAQLQFPTDQLASMTYFPPSVWALIQTMKHEIECAPLREHRARFAPTRKVIATAYCEWIPYDCHACEDAGLCGEVVDCHFSVETYDTFRRFDKHPVLDEGGNAVFERTIAW